MRPDRGSGRGRRDERIRRPLRSLVLQGGIYTPEEAKAFIAQPHAGDAVRLRLWDDLAKVENAVTPPLAHFVVAIEAAQRPVTESVASPSP